MRKVYFVIVGLFVFGFVDAQVINFPDANFKAKLLTSSTANTVAELEGQVPVAIDSNGDGEIQVSEAQAIIYLNINGSGINNLSGLENFTNLFSFGIFDNPVNNINLSGLSNLHWLSIEDTNITNVDLSSVPLLTYIWLSEGDFETVDVSMLPNLVYFESQASELIHMDFSQNPLLTYVNCRNSHVTSLNVSQNTALTTLYCDNNQLTSLNISGLSSLNIINCAQNFLATINTEGANPTGLDCSYNPLTQLDASEMTNLISVNIQNTLLSSVDLSECPLAHQLYANHCPNLTTILVKNGNYFDQLQYANSPNLTYMCVTDDYALSIQAQVNAWGYNCIVNSYCSFTPGGTFYSIQGSAKADINNNGCDNDDMPFPFFKVNLSNGTITGNSISDVGGNINIPVIAGTHTLTPIIENASYFNITPPSVMVNFPAQNSPFIQNFCIAPNGAHNDLEVTLFPANVARPGFDAAYLLIYKNKGTTTQSGTINLTFDDSILDLVFANPTVSTQAANNLNWSFSNLMPFESREIAVVLNVNSPIEMPPVNGGHVLNYVATITASTDETPSDNTSILNQTVVNSLDPNDKTCLEGNIVSPEMIGEYVHYIIRFENTGTANAQNVVLKDMIDTTKFDVNSLVPLNGSHSYVTRVNANKVEFIFENINLPFDDANNDGYVVFKIKTKPTLVVGDAFSNSANIYFDYNFPIATNTATTTINALGTSDFEFSEYFTLWPNPVKNTLNITAKNDIVMNSISIYNMLGQLVQVATNALTVAAIDVSDLKSGTYFVRINSGKGISPAKFIKE